jgi:hypothetical protein
MPPHRAIVLFSIMGAVFRDFQRGVKAQCLRTMDFGGLWYFCHRNSQGKSRRFFDESSRKIQERPMASVQAGRWKMEKPMK